jgi:hypothetical protein
LYVNGKVKVPLTGSVSFVDSDFVDISGFDPSVNCKDLTKGVLDGGGLGGGSGVVAPADGGSD